MKTYIITRFSILDESSNFWILTRENKNRDELKNKLFSEDRLSEKMKVFKNITYKSIINQENKNFIWLIVTSNELPEKYKSELYSIESENIKVYEVDKMSEFNKLINSYEYESEYCTARLDDDDGLSLDFVERLNSIYKNSDKSEIVSFPFGRKITFKDDKLYLENKTIYQEKIAIGLTKFNGNIYSCGNHNKVDEKYKVIYDYTEDMYLLYCSNNCDTKRKFNFLDCLVK
jgi:hypothetical protein